MYTRLSIRNFRGLRKVEVTGLKRINVVVGENGCGKTSLLEAAFLISGAANASLAMTLFGLRNDTVFTPGSDRVFRGLFRFLDPTHSIYIEADGDFKKVTKKRTRKLEISPITVIKAVPGSTAPKNRISGLDFKFQGSSGSHTGTVQWRMAKSENTAQQSRVPEGVHLHPHVPKNPDLIRGHFISPFRELWDQAHNLLTELTKQNRVNEVVDYLRIIEPRLKNIVPLSEDEVKVIYVDIGATALVPVALQGSGFGNVLHIVLDAISLNDGILVIDEIEDGLHHSVIDKLIRFLMSVAVMNNIQVFTTTHSDEILERIAHIAKAERFDDLAIFRLSRRDGEEVISSYSTEDLISSRDAKLELR